MVRTWRRELGLAREKQSTTTSDLQGMEEEKMFPFHVLTASDDSYDKKKMAEEIGFVTK